MSLPPLYSRRQRQANRPVNDVYIYDKLPAKVRVQIVHILRDGIQRFSTFARTGEAWQEMVEFMRKEKGVFDLGKSYEGAATEYLDWLLNEPELALVLDGIEVAFTILCHFDEQYNRDQAGTCREELNARLQEAAIGYQVHETQVVRVDNQIAHAEIVMPALQLLNDSRFAGAEDEYRDAHKHFRAGEFESCLIECGKAFESVLRVIGEERKWGIGPNDPASKLIASAFNSDFIPSYMKAQFSALRAVLESGVPTVRNRMAGHGAGGQVREVDRHLAAYQLHQTAAVIIFLVEHDKVTPS